MSIKSTSTRSKKRSQTSRPKKKTSPKKPVKSSRSPGAKSSIDKSKNINLLKSITDVAKEYELTEKTVKYHVARGNLKRESDGTFRRKEIEKWLEDRARKATGKKEKEDKHKQADFRYRIARAKREEFLLDQLKGELVSIKIMEEQFTARAFEASRRFLLLPRIVSNKLAIAAKKPLKEVMQIVESSVREILEDYTRPLNTKGDK